MARGRGCRAALALLPVLLLLLQARPGLARKKVDLANCASEWQMVMCGDIPLRDAKRLAACCDMNRPSNKPTASPVELDRPDVTAAINGNAPGVDYEMGTCTNLTYAHVPAFSRFKNTTRVVVISQPVPELTPTIIAEVKRAAINAAPGYVRKRYRQLRPVISRESGFLHPATFAGPAELALMQAGIERGEQTATAAKATLLTGKGVPQKLYSDGWGARTDTPLAGFEGPMPMRKLELGWGGVSTGENGECPPSYPPSAPANLCAHIAFVEVDAQMSFKQAMAYLATGDDRYAAQSMGIMQAWATKNEVFGPNYRNGPLEAAWGCGAMARAMELLRYTYPGFRQSQMDAFTKWVDSVLMPQMDYYVDVITPSALASRNHLFGNWHASVADCYIAYGVLTNNRTRYDKGVGLHRITVEDYFKWGREPWAKGRIIGESSETLRDIYHTQFALGSMLQAAEAAWVQGQDEYSVQNYALAAAMELHARFINAGMAKSEAELPAGFKFFENMPPAPDNCSAWRWDMESQEWSSYQLPPPIAAASVNGTDPGCLSGNGTDGAFNGTDASLNGTDASLNGTGAACGDAAVRVAAVDDQVTGFSSDAPLNGTGSPLNGTSAAPNGTDNGLAPNGTDPSLVINGTTVLLVKSTGLVNETGILLNGTDISVVKVAAADAGLAALELPADAVAAAAGGAAAALGAANATAANATAAAANATAAPSYLSAGTDLPYSARRRLLQSGGPVADAGAGAPAPAAAVLDPTATSGVMSLAMEVPSDAPASAGAATGPAELNGTSAAVAAPAAAGAGLLNATALALGGNFTDGALNATDASATLAGNFTDGALTNGTDANATLAGNFTDGALNGTGFNFTLGNLTGNSTDGLISAAAAPPAKCATLDDGFKYLVGIKYLPTGWELGYNHFVGRLGMKMPETALLLSKYPVDWYEFCWGLGTLTHANSAEQLWRPGVKRGVLCKRAIQKENPEAKEGRPRKMPRRFKFQKKHW